MTRLERFSLAFVLASSMGGRALAQEPSPRLAPGAAGARPTRRPAPAPTPDPRPVLELSLQDAVARALENNADIAVQKLNPQIGEENLQAGQGRLRAAALLDHHQATATPSRATQRVRRRRRRSTPTPSSSTSASRSRCPPAADLRLDFNNSQGRHQQHRRQLQPLLQLLAAAPARSSRCCGTSRSTTTATRSRWPSGTATSRRWSSRRRWSTRPPT